MIGKALKLITGPRTGERGVIEAKPLPSDIEACGAEIRRRIAAGEAIPLYGGVGDEIEALGEELPDDGEDADP